MNKNDVIFQRQSETLRFKNGDMDFMLNWAIGIGQIIGLSTAQVFHAVSGLKDGDARGWRSGFYRQAQVQGACARQYADEGNTAAAGQAYLGAAYAIRAVLQYTSPSSSDFALRISEMESAFAQGIHALGVPLRPIDVPFEDFSLCGYFLEHDAQPRPTVVMIGGGDTFREDLFYFAGYPGWMRGYNVIMVDLPGQGKLPACGAHFRPDMAAPIHAILDWLQANAALPPQQIALYGVSGGGYFSALAAHDPRVKAWIAATPIYDIGEVFRHEAGGALKTPGWLLNTAMRVIGSLNGERTDQSR
ncbi:MAG: CocE/NonD family hydrolase [Anaerolineae bacterium]